DLGHGTVRTKPSQPESRPVHTVERSQVSESWNREPEPVAEPSPLSHLPEKAQQIFGRLYDIAVDLTRALDDAPPSDIWRRYKSGERDVFMRRLWALDSESLRSQIADRYRNEPAFQTDVRSYMAEFESLLDAVSSA